MSTKIKYKYCNVCKHEVEHPSRKPLTRMQKTIWIIVIVATIGIAAIVYAIYLSTRPKEYCPDCHTKLVKSDQPFEKPKKKPEEMTPKERVLDKAGIEEKEEKPEKQPDKEKPTKEKPEENKIFCPYCGEELEEKVPLCTFCQSVIEW
jgi:cell division protein FtsL